MQEFKYIEDILDHFFEVFIIEPSPVNWSDGGREIRLKCSLPTIVRLRSDMEFDLNKYRYEDKRNHRATG